MNLQVLIMAVISKTDICRKIPKHFKPVFLPMLDSTQLAQLQMTYLKALNKRHYEITCLWGFQPGLTKFRLYSHRRWLEACNFGSRQKKDCTIYAAKT